jgi:hypothetical protein
VHQPMSALGQKRTHAAQQKGSLFDHLIGDLLEMQRHLEIQRLGGCHIDYQFKLGSLLDRQFSWFSAF